MSPSVLSGGSPVDRASSRRVVPQRTTGHGQEHVVECWSANLDAGGVEVVLDHRPQQHREGTDGRVLDIVDQHGRMTAGELAREIGLTTGAVTAVVDRLETARLLQRRGDPGDRRKVLIELTTGASRLGAEVYGPMAQATTPYIESLSDHDILTVIQFLEANRRINLELARTVRARIPTRKVPLRYLLEQAKALKTDAKTLLKTIKGEVKDLASVAIDLSGSKWKQDETGRWVERKG